MTVFSKSDIGSPGSVTEVSHTIPSAWSFEMPGICSFILLKFYPDLPCIGKLRLGYSHLLQYHNLEKTNSNIIN